MIRTQTNLHHPKTITAELSRKISGDKIHIGLLREPWFNNGRLQGLYIKNKHVIYDKTSCNPRAVIITDTSIKLMPFFDFIDGGTVTLLVGAELNGRKTENVIALAYFPDESDADQIQ